MIDPQREIGVSVQAGMGLEAVQAIRIAVNPEEMEPVCCR